MIYFIDQEIQTLFILHFDFGKYCIHVREVKDTARLYNTVWMLYKSLLFKKASPFTPLCVFIRFSGCFCFFDCFFASFLFVKCLAQNTLQHHSDH